MNKEQAISNIERLISQTKDRDYWVGHVVGYIDCCFAMGLLDFQESSAFSRRALGLPVD